MHYVGSGVSAAGVVMSSGFPVVTELAQTPAFDAVLLAGGSLDLTTGWSLAAGFQHYWTPTLRTSLYGFYGEFTYSAAASAAIPVAACSTLNCDWSMWQIGSRTVWNPVTNLDLSVDILYNQVDGVANGGGVADNKVGWLQGMVRAQRSFYP